MAEPRHIRDEDERRKPRIGGFPGSLPTNPAATQGRYNRMAQGAKRLFAGGDTGDVFGEAPPASPGAQPPYPSTTLTEQIANRISGGVNAIGKGDVFGQAPSGNPGAPVETNVSRHFRGGPEAIGKGDVFGEADPGVAAPVPYEPTHPHTIPYPQTLAEKAAAQAQTESQAANLFGETPPESPGAEPPYPDTTLTARITQGARGGPEAIGAGDVFGEAPPESPGAQPPYPSTTLTHRLGKQMVGYAGGDSTIGAGDVFGEAPNADGSPVPTRIGNSAITPPEPFPQKGIGHTDFTPPAFPAVASIPEPFPQKGIGHGLPEKTQVAEKGEGVPRETLVPPETPETPETQKVSDQGGKINNVPYPSAPGGSGEFTGAMGADGMRDYERMIIRGTERSIVDVRTGNERAAGVRGRREGEAMQVTRDAYRNAPGGVKKDQYAADVTDAYVTAQAATQAAREHDTPQAENILIKGPDGETRVQSSSDAVPKGWTVVGDTSGKSGSSSKGFQAITEEQANPNGFGKNIKVLRVLNKDTGEFVEGNPSFQVPDEIDGEKIDKTHAGHWFARLVQLNGGEAIAQWSAEELQGMYMAYKNNKEGGTKKHDPGFWQGIGGSGYTPNLQAPGGR